VPYNFCLMKFFLGASLTSKQLLRGICTPGGR
jgi:hypothetical protein